MDDYQLIDYDHSLDDRTCNAVLTAEGGRVEAAWTIDHCGGLVQSDCVIDGDAFARLWAGIEASLSSRGAFHAGLVSDPSRLVDPTTHHVVTAVQVFHGWTQHCTFMIPLHEVDPAFKTWLSLLSSTRQPLPALPTQVDATKAFLAA